MEKCEGDTEEKEERGSGCNIVTQAQPRHGIFFAWQLKYYERAFRTVLQYTYRGEIVMLTVDDVLPLCLPLGDPVPLLWRQQRPPVRRVGLSLEVAVLVRRRNNHHRGGRGGGGRHVVVVVVVGGRRGRVRGVMGAAEAAGDLLGTRRAVHGGTAGRREKILMST